MVEPKGSIMNPDSVATKELLRGYVGVIEISDDILEEIKQKTKKETMKDLVIKLKEHLAITESKQEPLFETYSLQQLYKCCEIYKINNNPLLTP